MGLTGLSSRFPIPDGKSVGRIDVEKHSSIHGRLSFFIVLLKNLFRECSSDASKTQTWQSSRFNVSFSDEKCPSWVKLLVEMKFKAIPLNHLLCVISQCPNRLLRLKVSGDSLPTMNGTFAISQQSLDLLTSYPRKQKISIGTQKPNIPSNNGNIASLRHLF